MATRVEGVHRLRQAGLRRCRRQITGRRALPTLPALLIGVTVSPGCGGGTQRWRSCPVRVLISVVKLAPNAREAVDAAAQIEVGLGVTDARVKHGDMHVDGTLSVARTRRRPFGVHPAHPARQALSTPWGAWCPRCGAWCGTGSRGFSRACRPTRRGDLFLHVIERGCVHRLRLGKPVRFVSSTGSPTGHGPDRPAGRDGCAGPNGPPLAASGRRLWSYWSRRPRSLQGSERETPERSRP